MRQSDAVAAENAYAGHRIRATLLICPTGCSAARLSSPIFKNISVHA